MSIITPPPYGRPDYSAPQALLDGPVIVSYFDAPNTQQTFGPFNVSQWWGISIYMSSIPHSFGSFTETGYTWHDDKGGTSYLGGAVVNTYWEQTWYGLCMPNLGPWLTVDTFNPSADGGLIQLNILPTNRIRPLGTYGNEDFSRNIIGGAIAAGGTATFTSGAAYVGRGVVSAMCTEDATLALNVATGGGFGPIVQKTLTAGQDYWLDFVFPPDGWQLEMTNTSATNGTYNLGVMPVSVGMS